jgi:hypothetical protein
MEQEDDKKYISDELYDADPNCEHDVRAKEFWGCLYKVWWV